MTTAASVPSVPVLAWMSAAQDVLDRLVATQADAMEQASQWCAEAIAADGLVHLFGTGHSRIPVEEMFPRYGSYPGFNPLVELSMTFHTQVVGANGQRQAMFIERMPGLAAVILDNFSFGPKDVMMVFSAGGATAVPVEMARGARARGLRVIAVTSVAQSMTGDPDPVTGSRLMDEADLVIDLCTPHADALVDLDGVDTPVGPGSTIAAVAVVNSIKVRTAQLLVERGALPPTITRASVVGAERSRTLFDSAYREHARRIARAIIRETDDGRSNPRQEVTPT
ncbi:MAG: SIS domain-containing protein [Chloroflexota bacterium]